MTPAEELRAAAARMRELAEAAPQGPYWRYQTPAGIPALRASRSVHGSGTHVAYFKNVVTGNEGERAADYFAAWPPVVTLAVADLLDAEADLWVDETDATPALAVARTFLGGAP